LTVDVKEGESASIAIVAVEKLLASMKPLSKSCVKDASELGRMADQIAKMKTMPAVEWDRHYRGYTGTPSEIIERHEESLREERQKTEEAMERSKKARELFNDLGGAAEWKDAKSDWEDYDYGDGN
jgi:hypothetical protein